MKYGWIGTFHIVLGMIRYLQRITRISPHTLLTSAVDNMIAKNNHAYVGLIKVTDNLWMIKKLLKYEKKKKKKCNNNHKFSF